ncbi:hypothetical protein DJ527_11190 [Sulfolobus sp. F1]|nr:hypothetical protein DJ527_11190 [Sulfolobus sp. F1]
MPITNFIGWYVVSLIIIIIFLFAYRPKGVAQNNVLFSIDYFLFSLYFFILAKPQLFTPLGVATLLP